VIAPDGLKGKRNSAGIAQSRILFRREPRIVLVSEAYPITALTSSAAIANTVNTKISREAARIHLAGAGDDPAGPGA
jgi:hypothetical protein